MSTCNQLDLQTLGSQTDDYIMLKKISSVIAGQASGTGGKAGLGL